MKLICRNPFLTNLQCIRIFPRYLVLVVMSIGMFIPGLGISDAHAIDTYWTGSVNSNWNETGNWTYGVPGPEDNAIFNGVTVTVSSIDDVVGNLILTNNAQVTLADTLTVSGFIEINSGTLHIGNEFLYVGANLSGNGSLTGIAARLDVAGYVSLNQITFTSASEFNLSGNWSIPNGGFDGSSTVIQFVGSSYQYVTTSADYLMYYWDEVIVNKTGGSIWFDYPFDVRSFTVEQGDVVINQLFTSYIDEFEQKGGFVQLGEGLFQVYVSFKLNGGSFYSGLSYLQLNAITAVVNGTHWYQEESLVEFNSGALQIISGSIIPQTGIWLFSGSAVTNDISASVSYSIPSLTFNRVSDRLKLYNPTGSVTATISGTLEFYAYEATGGRGQIYQPMELYGTTLVYSNGSALSYNRTTGVPITGPEWPNSYVPKIIIKSGSITLSETKREVDTLIVHGGFINGTIEYAYPGSYLAIEPSTPKNVTIGSEWPNVKFPESVSITNPGFTVTGYSDLFVRKSFQLNSGLFDLQNHSLIHFSSVEGSQVQGAGYFASGTMLKIGIDSVASKACEISGSLTLFELVLQLPEAELESDKTVTLINGISLLNNGGIWVNSGILNLNGQTLIHGTETELHVDGMVITGGTSLLGFSTYDFAHGTLKFNGQVGDEHIPTNETINVLIAANPMGTVANEGLLVVDSLLIFEEGVVMTSETSLIRLSDTAQFSGASEETGWITGPVQKVFNQTKTSEFPVGNMTRYRPATFTYTMEANPLSSIVQLCYTTTAFTAGTLPDGITEVRPNEHYTLFEVGTAPADLEYSLTLEFENDNFNPEDRNRLLIQNAETPTWTVPSVDPQTDISTELNTITVHGLLYFPTNSGIIAFGKGSSTIYFTGSQGMDWFTAANWSTGTLPTAVDELEIQNGITIILGDDDNNAETETPIQMVAKLYLHENASFIIESTNTAPTALLIGDGTGADTVLTVESGAELIIDGGLVKSVSLASGDELIAIRGTVTVKTGSGFGSGTGGLTLAASRQSWQTGSSMYFQAEPVAFQAQTYGNLYLSPKSKLIFNESFTTLNDFFIEAGIVSLANGSTSNKTITVQKNARVKNGATFIMGEESSSNNTLKIHGNFNRESTSTLVQHNGTVMELAGSTSQELCAQTSILANLKLSGAGSKKINCNLNVTNELIISDGIINTDSLEITVGTGIDNPGKVTYTTEVPTGKYSDSNYVLNAKKGGVNGKLRVWVPADTVSNIWFPITVNGERRDVVISYTQASTGGLISINFHLQKAVEYGLPLVDNDHTRVEYLDPVGYWTIKPLAGLSGGTYTVELFATNIFGVSSPSQLRVVKREDETQPWELLGVHEDGLITEDGEVVSKRKNLTGFSDFIIAGSSENPLPVELTDWNAVVSATYYAELSWTTATEKNNYGFTVERMFKADATTDSNWTAITFVEGSNTSYKPRTYSYSDKSVSTSGEYVYRLIQMDFDGKTTTYDPISVYIEKPQQSGFTQIAPNPFNPSTTVSFTISEKGRLQLMMYDITGRLVSRLADAEYQPGNYHIPVHAHSLASGMYVMVLQINGIQQAKTITLLK